MKLVKATKTHTHIEAGRFTFSLAIGENGWAELAAWKTAQPSVWVNPITLNSVEAWEASSVVSDRFDLFGFVATSAA